ncbi:methyltransferase domain-containing protein [Streptomyces abikoensis]|uniref:SAM-dependent methyltransferase n=1 Tax=Streptomyces TaxID=1883 RepID=UPI0033D1554F
MPHPFSGRVGELYDRLTDLIRDTYDDNFHYGYWPDPAARGSLAKATERMTDQLIARLAARPGHTVLDVGGGTGKPALRLARETGADVVGVNVSRHQVDIANAKARAEGLHERVRFDFADAMDLPYPDAAFDGIWALESMLHMPDRPRVLREAARVLRPGGRMVIADIALRAAVEDEASRTAVARFCAIVSARSLERIDAYPRAVVEAGLELLELTDISAHTYPTLLEMLDCYRSAHSEHVAVIGEEALVERIETFESIVTVPQFGYVLLTARKP